MQGCQNYSCQQWGVPESLRIIIYLHGFGMLGLLPMYLSKALKLGYLPFNCIIKEYFIYYCSPTATLDCMLTWFDHSLLKRKKKPAVFIQHAPLCFYSLHFPDTLQLLRICKMIWLYNIFSTKLNLCYKISHHRKHTFRVRSLKSKNPCCK